MGTVMRSIPLQKPAWPLVDMMASRHCEVIQCIRQSIQQKLHLQRGEGVRQEEEAHLGSDSEGTSATGT